MICYTPTGFLNVLKQTFEIMKNMQHSSKFCVHGPQPDNIFYPYFPEETVEKCKMDFIKLMEKL